MMSTESAEMRAFEQNPIAAPPLRGKISWQL